MKFLTRFKQNSKRVRLAKPRGRFRTKFGTMAVLLGTLMAFSLIGCRDKKPVEPKPKPEGIVGYDMGGPTKWVKESEDPLRDVKQTTKPAKSKWVKHTGPYSFEDVVEHLHVVSPEWVFKYWNKDGTPKEPESGFKVTSNAIGGTFQSSGKTIKKALRNVPSDLKVGPVDVYLGKKIRKKPAEELPGGVEGPAKNKGKNSGGPISSGLWTPDSTSHFRRGKLVYPADRKKVLPCTLYKGGVCPEEKCGKTKKKPAKKKLKKSKGILIPPRPGRQGIDSSL